MRILVITNLFPPHHGGTFDFRCQEACEALKKRGHELKVLTSKHGLSNEQRDSEVERRLIINGKFDQPLATSYGEIKQIEAHNNEVLRETLEEYGPQVVYVWSLAGISKSLIFNLRNLKVPAVYGVGDDWLSAGVREDPWLRWWNRPGGPLLSGLWRMMLEVSGQRDRMNTRMPTRMMKGYERVKEVYGPRAVVENVEPNAVGAFHFERIYFCSDALKTDAERAGFRVGHGEVIYPGIATDRFYYEVKPPSAPVKKFLLVSRLSAQSGAMTAVEALKLALKNRVEASLSIYGRGESEQMAQLRSYVVQHSLPVEFLTVSNQQKDVAQAYRQHDALLYTAEWDEPFAVTPLEAMASGIPVIGARSGGARELLRHGENALTFTPGDALELASRMQELQMQPALRYQMAETAQSEVMGQYSESYMLDRVESYLQETMEVWQET